MALSNQSWLLTLTCIDCVGVVAAVSSFIANHDGFILDSQQFADVEQNRFFMRVAFRKAGPRMPEDKDSIRRAFAPLALEFGFDWLLDTADRRPRIVVAVSRSSHCLVNLLHRWRTGILPVEIMAVFSNHEVMRDIVEWHGVAWRCLPIDVDGSAAQEAEIVALMEAVEADYLILARYMQVLSPSLVDRLQGRCVNIHHSFLPAFKGAKPYHRAHERGVKLIGATAHFVTTELDEGPIIEQAVQRVDHRDGVDDLIRIGRDVEAQVLARAVTWLGERRVLLNSDRTVVFR